MCVLFNFQKLRLNVIVIIYLTHLTVALDLEESSEVTTEAPAALDPIDTLDETKCMKKRTGCCEQLDLGDDDVLMKCFALNQNKMPPPGTQDPGKLIKFLSCFVECMYKHKKFIAKGDNINMKMVKADAEKRFAGRPKEKEYQITMFDHCRKEATKTYTTIKMNPGAKIMLKDACKPYLLFVFLCNSEYPKKIECPYFKWEGKRKTPAQEDCFMAKEKCYEVDGIAPP